MNTNELEEKNLYLYRIHKINLIIGGLITHAMSTKNYVAKSEFVDLRRGVYIIGIKLLDEHCSTKDARGMLPTWSTPQLRSKYSYLLNSFQAGKITRISAYGPYQRTLLLYWKALAIATSFGIEINEVLFEYSKLDKGNEV